MITVQMTYTVLWANCAHLKQDFWGSRVCYRRD